MAKITTRRDDITKLWIAEATVNDKDVLIKTSGPVETVTEMEALRQLAIALAERLAQIYAAVTRIESIPLPQSR